MTKSITAYTYEIDDIEAAVSGIISQLEPLNRSKNMIGIVTCSYDYIESGIIAALNEALPFEIIGETTVSQTVHGEAGLLLLTMLVLYSDDCRFVCDITDELPDPGDMKPIITKSYEQTSAHLGEKPKLILIFPPLLNTQAGDSYVNILSALSERTPIFGSLCADDTTDTYVNAYTIYRGEAYKNRMTYVMIAGDINPEFRIASVSGESRLPYKGEITGSNGNLLTGINDVSTVNYLETIGLAGNGKIRSGINSIPFLINFENEAGADNVSVARVMFTTTPENYAVCGGEMPIGASITAGICDKDDVVSTTKQMIEDIGKNYKGKTALLFSCIGRRYALALEPLLEAQIAADEMSGDISFLFSYSSGEFCPTSVSEGGATNRFHNYTFVACIF